MNSKVLACHGEDLMPAPLCVLPSIHAFLPLISKESRRSIASAGRVHNAWSDGGGGAERADGSGLLEFRAHLGQVGERSRHWVTPPGHTLAPSLSWLCNLSLGGVNHRKKPSVAELVSQRAAVYSSDGRTRVHPSRAQFPTSDGDDALPPPVGPGHSRQACCWCTRGVLLVRRCGLRCESVAGVVDRAQDRWC